jgi:Holliday junction resolvase RusA-like endonuclease
MSGHTEARAEEVYGVVKPSLNSRNRIIKKEEIGHAVTKMLLSFPQSVNHYLHHFCRRCSAAGLPQDMGVTLSDKAKQFKNDAGWEAKAAGMRVLDGEVAVRMDVYIGKSRADIDNLSKLVLDSLINIAYEDDRQVADLHIVRHQSKGPPRLEVTVQKLPIQEG